MNNWWIYKGTGVPHDGIEKLPPPPSWRQFTGTILQEPTSLSSENGQIERHLGKGARGAAFQANDEEIELVNAALYLRRPLLITGKPGSGKSSLAHAVAYELKLGPVLHWSITTRTTLKEGGLYQYDAIGRLQDASLKKDGVPDIGRYVRLGPLGTALLPTHRPRVLLIDEIDKSDIDLPNDLLNIFEEGYFDIPELARLPNDSKRVSVMPYGANQESEKVLIENGRVQCAAFPFIVLTSNGERDFPPAFLRRCLRLIMQPPDKEKLTKIVEAQLDSRVLAQAMPLIETFLSRRAKGDLATDQLLNAIYLSSRGVDIREKEKLLDVLLKYLTDVDIL